MEEGDWEAEVDAMIVRALATRDFVSNLISPDDFAEALFETGVDPNHAFEMWEEGKSASN